MAKLPSMDTNIPGVWYGLHYYQDTAYKGSTISNTAYACLNTTNYRKTFTLATAMTVRVHAEFMVVALVADGWRQIAGIINYGTGADSLIGGPGSGLCYHYTEASGNVFLANVSLFGQKDLAAGEHTIEIRARTWDASTAYTKLNRGSWAIDVKR